MSGNKPFFTPGEWQKLLGFDFCECLREEAKAYAQATADARRPVERSAPKKRGRQQLGLSAAAPDSKMPRA